MNVHVSGATSASPAAVRNPQPASGHGFAAAFAQAQADVAGVRSPLLAPLLLPTRANVQQLASELGQTLSARFAAAGLPAMPAVGFAVDANGAVRASGNRSDLARIQGLVDGDGALQRSIRDVDAIASHAYEIENGGQLEFQRAYRLSADPKEIVAQYASLPGGRRSAAALSVAFSAGHVSVAVRGRSWLGA